MKLTHWTQYWHQINASHRLTIISLVGLAAFFLLPADAPLTVRVTISWICAGLTYLLLTYIMMYFARDDSILDICEKEDDGATTILLIIVLGGLSSLIAIVIILSDLKTLPKATAAEYIALVLTTYTVSWFFVHTAFALRYAHIYYRDLQQTKVAPLVFDATLKPGYVDFLYFSMVIGMTCQTADINIANSRMRLMVMVQGLTAFTFNATLLGLAINLISGVISL